MQKEKLKTQKGITLIALIITIIIMLILVGVTVTVALQGGLFDTAKEASQKTADAAKQETEMLQYEYQIAYAKGETTESYVQYVLDKKYPGVKIGDYVNYNELSNGTKTHTPDTAKGAGTSRTGSAGRPGSSSTRIPLTTTTLTTEDLKWRVLGVNEKGELELISADPASDDSRLYLANDEGYVNAEDNLNNFCNDLYGKGTYATGARSLNAEDINKFCDKETDSRYGVEWTYRYPTQEEMDEFTGTANSTRYMQYSTDGGETWTNITSSKYQTFRLPEETTAISSNNTGSKKLTHTCYSLSDSITESGYTAEEATEISNMIKKGTTSSEIYQWLASTCVECDGSEGGTPGVQYSCFRVMHIGYNGGITNSPIFSSNGFFYFKDYRVRPIVTLKSNINITGSGESIGTVDNMWQIS